jgi:ketosteroid isomerase-like protein
MAHPNEDVVRAGFTAFAQGDMDARQQIFAPDIRWHFPGRSPLAGDHNGVDRVIEFIGLLFGLSGGTHSIELHDVIGNDEHVVALHTTRAERGGRKLEVNAAQILPRPGRQSDRGLDPAR